MSRVKIVGLVILSIIAILLLALHILLPHLLHLDEIRSVAEKKASEAFGRRITISGAKLSLLPNPGIRFEDISISDVVDFNPDPVVNLTSLDLSTEWDSIFMGRLDFNKISIVEPKVRLIRNARGAWNFEETALAISGAILPLSWQNKEIQKLVEFPLPVTFAIQVLTVIDGEVLLEDVAKSIFSNDLLFKGINARLTNDGFDSPVMVSASLDAPGEDSRVLVDGEVGPLGKDPKLDQISVDITVNAQELKFKSAAIPAVGIPLVITGGFQTKESIRGTLGEGFRFEQSAEFVDVSLDSEKGFPVARDLSGSLQQKGMVHPASHSIQIDHFNLVVEDMNLTATGKVRHNGILPELDLKFQSSMIDLSDLAKHFPDIESRMSVVGNLSAKGLMTGTVGKDLTASLEAVSSFIEMDRGPLLLNRTERTGEPDRPSHVDGDLPYLLPPNLPLSVSARITVADGRFEWISFSDLKSEIRVKNRWASLDKMEFSAFGGRITGSSWFNMRKLPATYGNDIRIRNMEIDRFLTSFAGLEGILYGTASLDLFVSGRGRNMDQFKETTTGLGKFQITSGKYTPANFLKEVLEAASLKTGFLHSDETEFNSMDSNIAVRGGRIDFTSLDCVADDWGLKGSGIIGLDQSLSLRYRMILSDSTASKIGAENLKTLPKDKNSHFQIPFRLSGTFTSPLFSFDSKAMDQIAEK